MARSKTGLSGKAQDALNDLDELKGDHDVFVENLRQMEDAYDGIYRRMAEVANWSHRLTPRYAQHIIETTVAAIGDEDLRFQVRPRPKLYEPDEWLRVQKGARAMEVLLGFQMEQDRIKEKQRALILQERMGGISWAKVYWRTSRRLKKKLERDSLFPQLVVTEQLETVYDGPCVEALNSRDVVWDMGATDVARCPLIGHRIWVTFEEAKAYEKLGVWRNVDALKDRSNAVDDGSDADKRKQGRHEVWEIWRREQGGKINVYTIGERNTLLGERENPYWHGELPFVPFSARSKPLMLKGWSQMELLRDIQEQLWSVSNLRLDALMLSIMPIIMYREDVDDPDALVFEPYARWPVTDPNQVRMWTPEYSQAQVSLPTEQMLKADMQNISGGSPFTTTGEARTVGANTATEASLVSSIGQRSMTQAKIQFYYSLERIGQQMLELDQQYVRETTWATVVDLDERSEVVEILPESLQGDLAFSLRPMTESLLRQERRAEALAKFQALMQTVPVFAMAGQPLNLQAILEDFLEAHDAGPVERYLSAQPQQVPTQPAAPGQPGPGGTTNPALAAGPMSPSNQASVNPAAMMQQAGAMSGGGQSV